VISRAVQFDESMPQKQLPRDRLSRELFVSQRSNVDGLIGCDGSDMAIPDFLSLRRSSMSQSPSAVQVSLSAQVFRNLPKGIYENDFTFIVGESRYCCLSFIASFLSSRICRLQAIDPTFSEFGIETKDPHHCFTTILERHSLTQ
jgi:hypothetical protein